jgi:hypothetical protein
MQRLHYRTRTQRIDMYVSKGKWGRNGLISLGYVQAIFIMSAFLSFGSFIWAMAGGFFRSTVHTPVGMF